MGDKEGIKKYEDYINGADNGFVNYNFATLALIDPRQKLADRLRSKLIKKQLEMKEQNENTSEPIEIPESQYTNDVDKKDQKFYDEINNKFEDLWYDKPVWEEEQDDVLKQFDEEMKNVKVFPDSEPKEETKTPHQEFVEKMDPDNGEYEEVSVGLDKYNNNENVKKKVKVTKLNTTLIKGSFSGKNNRQKMNSIRNRRNRRSSNRGFDR